MRWFMLPLLFTAVPALSQVSQPTWPDLTLSAQQNAFNTQAVCNGIIILLQSEITSLKAELAKKKEEPPSGAK